MATKAPAKPKPTKKTAPKVKKPLGRPSSFTQAVADAICLRLSKGEPLAQICRDDNMPSVSTVTDWKAKHDHFSVAIARSREEGFDAIAVDTLNIIDTVPERCATAEGDKVDSGHVAWLKNRAEQRLKLLAKWDPKRYGDKMDVNHGGQENNPIEVRTKVVMVPTKQKAENITRPLDKGDTNG